MKKFSKIYIEISNVCNLQCSFCPEVIRENKLMSVELFELAVQQAAPLTEQVCFHLMGDPLVHPKLEQFAQICATAKVPVNLVSNGVLLNEKRAQLLLSPAFRQVNFSLHSFPDNFPDKDPTEYLEKIFQFTERAFQERPDLYINYRLWNLQDVREEEASAKNKELLARIENRFSWKLEEPVDVRQNKSRKIKNRLYLHFDTEFIWPSLDLPILGDKGFCHGLTSHCGILADGTVVPCCLDKEGKIPLGNLNDSTLTEILTAPRARSIVKGFQERKLKEELCKRCNYIERFS